MVISGNGIEMNIINLNRWEITVALSREMLEKATHCPAIPAHRCHFLFLSCLFKMAMPPANELVFFCRQCFHVMLPSPSFRSGLVLTCAVLSERL